MAVGVKELATKYGPIAVGTYLSISFATFCALFVAIENHLDIEEILKRVLGANVDVETTLRAWGYRRTAAAEDGISWSSGSYIYSKVPSVALAMLGSKALIPLKVPLAAALTPYVARILEARGLIHINRK